MHLIPTDGVRLAELVAALSLGVDLGFGQPMEHVLRQCLIAMTWCFADHEEVFEAGDAYYVPPGHAPKADAGSEFVQFSPSEQLQAVEQAMMERMREIQGK